VSTPYTARFYDAIRKDARRSAEVVVPLVVDLVRPTSVVDVGCGVGTWLAVFREWGVEDVHGIDGAWVDRAVLEIPQAAFSVADLTRPFAFARTFDLAVSLEVAEHLPPDAADVFVDSLTALAPVVAFSAAIPLQGGTKHVNEQWPEYWAERFEARHYVTVDAVRRLIWDDERVQWYYAQNLLLFARPSALVGRDDLRRAHARTCRAQLAQVHPRYLEAVSWRRRVLSAAADVAAAVPSSERMIVVDQDLCGPLLAAERASVPFLERDGVYWGPPVDDDTALRELERLRHAGYTFVVVAWTAFWWLDYYPALRSELDRHRRIVDNERVVIFDLR
jgi:SAM-dependent methyltransferase